MEVFVCGHESGWVIDGSSLLVQQLPQLRNIGLRCFLGEALGDAITFARGTTDFATIVQRISETEADGIFVMAGPGEAGLLAQELARQGEQRPILGHRAQRGGTFFEAGGEDINNWVIPSIFDRSSSDEDAQAHVAAMDDLNDEPPTVSEAANCAPHRVVAGSGDAGRGIDGNTSSDEARAAIQA